MILYYYVFLMIYEVRHDPVVENFDFFRIPSPYLLLIHPI